MALFTDTDSTDAAMNGDQSSSVPTPIANALKKKNRFVGPPYLEPAGAGAGSDGTNNGGTNPNNGARSSKPVVQDSGTDQTPRVVGANPNLPDSSEITSDNEVKDVMHGEQKPVMPTLAKQGSSNPILRAIQKATGFVKDSPAPGEMYTGPATPEQKEAHLSKVGKVMTGVAEGLQSLGGATGGAQQRQIYSELPIEEEKLGQQHELALAQLDATKAYRQGQLELGAGRLGVAETNAKNQQARTGIQQQGENTKESVAQANANAKGLKIQADGSVRPMTADEVLQDPRLSMDQNLKAASIQQKQAESDLAGAHRDALMNPNNPTFAQREREIQARLAMARQNLNARLEGLSMAGQRDEFNLGVNTLTGQRLENDPNAPAGMVANPSGAPTPYRQQGMYAPTSQEKNVGAQAKIVSDSIPSVITSIQKNAASMGPLMGRWNEFAQGRIGVQNSEFAEMQTTLVMMASAVALAHARGRLPENLRQEFDHMINAPQQDPANVVAVLQAIQPWMSNMAGMGTIPQANAGQGLSPAPTSAPVSQPRPNPVKHAVTSTQKSPFDK